MPIHHYQPRHTGFGPTYSSGVRASKLWSTVEFSLGRSYLSFRGWEEKGEEVKWDKLVWEFITPICTLQISNPAKNGGQNVHRDLSNLWTCIYKSTSRITLLSLSTCKCVGVWYFYWGLDGECPSYTSNVFCLCLEDQVWSYVKLETCSTRVKFPLCIPCAYLTYPILREIPISTQIQFSARSLSRWWLRLAHVQRILEGQPNMSEWVMDSEDDYCVLPPPPGPYSNYVQKFWQ